MAPDDSASILGGQHFYGKAIAEIETMIADFDGVRPQAGQLRTGWVLDGEPVASWLLRATTDRHLSSAAR